MIQRAQTKIFFLIVATAIMLACVPAFAPASPIPTFDPNSVITAIAETSNAASTQTALFITPTLTPTFTPTPSKTPTETPSPTATFLYLIYSPTSPSAGKPSTPHACTILSQEPENNTILAANMNFSVRWRVRNSGSAPWDANNADYYYVSGAKMHLQAGGDLYKTVSPGETADVIAEMKTPEKPGAYTTTWTLRNGKIEFCALKLTIEVK